MPRNEIERVLVAPTALFRRLGYFQGFCGNVEPYLNALLRPENMSFRPRDQVEKDPSYKQLIPYMIFRHLDPASRATVFQYTRGKGQGEGRLHSKRSVGIGGHISAIDAGIEGGHNPYEEGRQRELEEEVAVESPYHGRCVGLINDDETEVGTVHLGVVHLFDVDRPAIWSPRAGPDRVRFSAGRGDFGRHDRLRDVVANLHEGAVRRVAAAGAATWFSHGGRVP